MDITSAIMDPELGCSAFTVERLTYTRIGCRRRTIPRRSSLTDSLRFSPVISTGVCWLPASGAEPIPVRCTPGDTVDNGFALWVAPYDNQSDADRAAHKAVPVQVGLVLAGSIEPIVITVNVMV